MQTTSSSSIADVARGGPLTIVNATAPRLERLCTALEIDVAAAMRLLASLSDPWGRRPIQPCRWPSIVGDDHSPCELSLALADRADHAERAELRIMVEPLGDPPTLASNRDASLALLRRLVREGRFDIDLSRLNAISDLFFPAVPHGAFAIWIAAGLSAGDGRTNFKVYLNPEARGPGRAQETVEDCMTRLGFSRAWNQVARVLVGRGPAVDQLMYVSLDLSRGAAARLKIYARHQHATPADLERAAAPAATSRPGELHSFVRLCVPELSTFSGRAPFTCWSFVAGGDEPIAATTHLPLNGYAPTDAVIRRRVLSALGALGIESGSYERALAAVADRPLDAGIGLQSYVSFRRDTQGPRLTVYLPIEAHQRGVVAAPTFTAEPSDAASIVRRFEELEPITIHPTLCRLAREPVNCHALWTILANFQISISAKFAGHLARITARVEDERVRSILAHQLDDELGNGNPDRAHVRLFAAMMDDLLPWRPPVITDETWMPGRRFDDHLREAYEAADSWEAVGAVMVGEVYGKQIDLFLGQQLRRQSEIDTESLGWLVLHERLEVEHAEDSAELAGFVPAEALPAVWRGAQRAGRAGYAFLDDLYELCFGQ